MATIPEPGNHHCTETTLALSATTAAPPTAPLSMISSALLKADHPKGRQSGYSCSRLITGAGIAAVPSSALLRCEVAHAVLFEN